LIKEERVEALAALNQWMESQDIPRADWGPFFAVAAGVEIDQSCKRLNAGKEWAMTGHRILSAMMATQVEALK